MSRTAPPPSSDEKWYQAPTSKGIAEATAAETPAFNPTFCAFVFEEILGPHWMEVSEGARSSGSETGLYPVEGETSGEERSAMGFQEPLLSK